MPILLCTLGKIIQYPAVMEMYESLVVIARVMGDLKCAYHMYGEEFVVIGSGIVSMLVLFASSWDFHNMVIV